MHNRPSGPTWSIGSARTGEVVIASESAYWTAQKNLPAPRAAPAR